MTIMLLYALGTAAFLAASLMAADQLVRANRRDQMPHRLADASTAAACILLPLGSGLVVFAFTGTPVPLFVLSALTAAVGGAAYARHYRGARLAAKAWEAQREEEERQVRETAARDPLNAAAWAGLARARERRGDLKGAAELFAKVCELEPTRGNLEKMGALREAASLPPPPAETGLFRELRRVLREFARRGDRAA